MFSHPPDPVTPIEMEQIMTDLKKPNGSIAQVVGRPGEPAQKPESKPGPTLMQRLYANSLYTSVDSVEALITERDAAKRALDRSHDAREMERRLTVEIENELANVKAEHFIARQLLDDSTKVIQAQNATLKQQREKIHFAFGRGDKYKARIKKLEHALTAWEATTGNLEANLAKIKEERDLLEQQNQQFRDPNFLPAGCQTCREREKNALERARAADASLAITESKLVSAIRQSESLARKLSNAGSCVSCMEGTDKANQERDRFEEERDKALDALDDLRNEAEEQAQRLENQATTIRTMRSSPEFILAQELGKKARDAGPGKHIFSVECVVPDPVTPKEDDVRKMIRSMFGIDFPGMGG